MLRCVSQYKSGVGSWNPGDTVDNPEIEDWLLRDSFESWMVIERVIAKDEVYVTASVESDDKMIRRGRPKKVQDEII